MGLEAPPQLWLRPLQGVGAVGLSARELAWGRELDPPIRQRYWQSRAALRHWVAGCLGCRVEEVPLLSPPGRPPRLEAGAGHVSLSHSGPMLLVAWSTRPVGVDLERADRPLAAAAIARRYFPPAEWAELQAMPPEALHQAVLRSWVLKEAAIKWRQRTLAEELRAWRYCHRSGRLRHGTEGLTPASQAAESQGWHWAVVGDGAPDARFMVLAVDSEQTQA
ncbi:MAG: 4'-phosphopantetheinyl transferase family protein [Cyanobacteriota bacterium]